MDISKLARKPKLQKLVLKDDDIIEMFGEPIEFYMYDHVDITSYFNFYKVQQSQDAALLNELLRKLVLKEDGTPAIKEEEVLPTQIVLSILIEINNFLGKSNPEQSLTEETGEPQN